MENSQPRKKYVGAKISSDPGATLIRPGRRKSQGAKLHVHGAIENTIPGKVIKAAKREENSTNQQLKSRARNPNHEQSTASLRAGAQGPELSSRPSIRTANPSSHTASKLQHHCANRRARCAAACQQRTKSYRGPSPSFGLQEEPPHRAS